MSYSVFLIPLGGMGVIKKCIQGYEYTDFHFTLEENIATSCNLPGVSGHHQRHLELLEEFNHRAENLSKGLTTVDDFLGFLTDWFVGHTIYEDQKLFEAI